MDRERAQAFAADGLVVVPGAIPPAVIAAQRAALAEALAVDGVDLDDAATWRAGGGLPWIELAGALRPAPTAAPRMWQVSPPAVHDALIAGFAAALDAVFGAAQWAAQPGVAGHAQPAAARPAVDAASPGLARRRADRARRRRALGPPGLRGPRADRARRWRDRGDRRLAPPRGDRDAGAERPHRVGRGGGRDRREPRRPRLGRAAAPRGPAPLDRSRASTWRSASCAATPAI
jgi:hypothetical protein